MDCQTCTTKTCLNTGKPCRDIELMMKKEGIYGRDWIRPRVSPVKMTKDQMGKWREMPVENIDDVAIQRALHIKGRKKETKKYNETQ